MTDSPPERARPDGGSAAAIRTELADPERAVGMAHYFQARPGGYGEATGSWGSRCRRNGGSLGGTPRERR